ncbi:YidC/Oxa1 family membrane protein insertase [Desulfobaculum xiamenense]|uniref:Membrane protein insertase YidC n=1 Tax=Desulfobaculum xiamenense TaxID=995050 RepID=A0A846QMZ9_9BACT|nr:membrane protein insertase YidC [Desulfobaculum xiamenense]NJB68390.1 YidC/Oxa1 family membrane protein insertase [Desulfobaculum xiamenense]
MDNKRVILAVGLSMIVLVVWSYFFGPQPGQNPAQTNQTQTEQAQTLTAPDATAPAVPAEAPAFVASAGRDVVVETPLYKAIFNSEGGVLTSFELKRYKETIEPGSRPVNLVSDAAINRGTLGLLWNGQGTWRDGQWAAPEADSLSLLVDNNGSLTFTGQVGDLLIHRTFSFQADNYLINEKVSLTNTSTTPQSGRLGFAIASADLTGKEDRYNPTRVSFLTSDGVDNESDRDDLAKGIKLTDGVQWGAVQSNYFTLAVAPEPGDLTLRTNFQSDLFRLQLDKEAVDLAPGAAREIATSYYFGPVMEQYLDAAPGGLSQLVTYGFFDVLSKPLLKLLHFFHGFVGNWGVAIILLTILIKIVFWPLSHKSYKSMNQMKKIQPLMAKVREQYKDDRQKMNEEMMRLYKTYKVNPAGGCLPMMLQIPVFFGLYQALLGAIELRHAPFITHVPFTDIIWLADLSAKDPFYVTPLIMGASMFLQQKMTPAPGDPTQAKMMLFMPVIFTFLFLNFPAGLVVYWLVNNILSIAQQWMMLRKA